MKEKPLLKREDLQNIIKSRDGKSFKPLFVAKGKHESKSTRKA